jgi:uncharacterized glyoxalase superfamily protein PhnB
MPEVHIYIEIDDLERGIEFYVDGLGLTVKRRLTERWVELAGAQMPIHLLARPEPEFESGEHVLQKVFSRHWTPVHLDFVVTGIEAVVQKLVSAGATLERPILERKWGRMANLADPFGHGLDLLEFKGRGYDELLLPGS